MRSNKTNVSPEIHVPRWAVPVSYTLRNQEPDEADAFTPGEIFRALRRSAATLILCAIAGLAIAVSVGLAQKPVYRARMLLEIDTPNRNFLNLKAVDPSAEDYVSENLIKTQIEKLQTSSILEGVAQELRLQERAEFVGSPGLLSYVWAAAPTEPRETADRVIQTMARNLSVRGTSSRLIEVTYESTDAQLAADVANAIGQELIRQTFDRRATASRRTAESLLEQLQDLKVNLERSESQLTRYATEAGLPQTIENGSVAELRLQQLQEKLSNAEEARVMQRARFDRLKSSSVDELPEALDDTTLRSYHVSLADLRRQAAELSQILTPQHYKMKQVSAQIAEMESALRREQSNIQGRIKNAYEAAQQREQLLRDEYERQTAVVASQGRRLVQYSILKREVDTHRQLYEAMLQRVKEVGIASAVPGSNTQMIDPARPPSHPSKPSLPLYAMVGFMSGSLLGAAYVFLGKGRVITAPGDANVRLRFPELGVIPNALDQEDTNGAYRNAGWQAFKRGFVITSSGPDPRNELALISWQRKNSIVAESFRATLASVLFSGLNGESPHTIVITSACPGEGKTVVSSNFAIALAEMKHKVLLVDGDLRRPRLHRIFNLPNTRGLGDILAEPTPCAELSGQDLGCTTEVPGLYVLPSGSANDSTPNLLYSERAAELLTRLRDEFDAVLIDTPPLCSSDARGLGRLADGVVLVVRADRTSEELALAALRRLQEDGTRVLGTVLNSWNPKKSSVYGPGASSYTHYVRTARLGPYPASN